MPTNIGTAFFNVTFNTAPARRELTALVSTANRQFGLLGGVTLVAATAAIAGLVNATARIGAAALEASIDYEDAFAGVRKTVDDGSLSAQEASVVFGKLNQDLRDLALDIPLDLEDDISKIAELGGQLGIPADQLVEFTRIIGEVGVTTNVAVEDAATSFARLANIMGLSSDDFRELGDTLINLGNKLPAQEDEILRFANRIAAAGEIAGFTVDEVLAVGAAFSSVGVPSERGGTAVQRTWIKITQAVAEGGEILDLIAQVSGETSEQFQKHWQEDASGAWTDFIEGLGAAGTGAFQILKDLGLNDQRVIQSLLSLASAGDLMRTTFALAEDDLNALGIESTLRFATTRSQLQLLINTVHDAGLTIGNEMKPAFNEGIDLAIKWFQENQPLIKSIGENLAGALENLIPLIDNVISGLAGIVEKTAEIAGSEPVKDTIQAIEDFDDRGLSGNTVGANIIDFLTQGPLLGQGVVDTADSILDAFTFGGGEALLGNAGLAQLTIIEDRLRAIRDSGENFDAVDLIAQAFLDLDAALEPLGQDVSAFGLAEIIDEFDTLSETDLSRLVETIGVENLNREMLVLLGLLESVNAETGSRKGRGGFRPSPLTVEEIQTRAQVALENEADLVSEQEATFKALRDAADEYGVSIDVVLDNYERLAPAAATAMESMESGLGEAQIRADLFNQSLETLKTNMEFRPATEGMFGIGPLTEQIQLAERTIASSGDKVKLHGADVQKNILANLQTIADFEANLTILVARGQEELAEVLAEFGPEASHVAEDFVGGFRTDAGLVEASLEAGGTISSEMQAALDAEFQGKPVPQAVLDFVANLGSDAVTSTVYDAAYASGQQYGDGFEAGMYASLPPWLAGFLGLEGAPPTGTMRFGENWRPGGNETTVYQSNYFYSPPPTSAAAQRTANAINNVRVNTPQ